jgi:DNA polymerase-3 subunit beta
MKVTMPTAHLLEAVGHAAAVASSKSTKPIYECVALRAERATGLSLEATDLDVGLRVHVDDSRTEIEGAVAIPAARLLAIAREIEEDETTLATSDRGLEISTAGSRFTVRHESLEEFPAVARFPSETPVRLPGAIVRDMVRRTAFAAAREPGRFALHGIQITVGPKRLRMVATDGRRLAHIERDLPGGGPKEPLTLLVGPKALLLLERALGTGLQGDLELALVDRQLLARVGGLLVTSRLIDGSFPAVEGVIPAAPPHPLVVGVAALSAGLRRASLLTTRDSLSVEVQIGPDGMQIRSRAQELGEAQVDVDVRYDGPALRVGFNPAYIQDALKVMDPASDVQVGLADAKSPARISDQEDYVYVVSPVSLE